MTSAAPCTVYFDGGCPLCRREIAHYRGRHGAESIAWVDAAACAPEALGADLSRSAALARLHVRRPDGSLVTGAAAFATIWRQLPGYRWLGFAVRGPGLRLLDLAYGGFLRLRRLWRRAPTPAGLAPGTLAAMRANHVLEAAGLQLYRGVLASALDGALRAFAAHRLAMGHLRLQRVRRWLPASVRSPMLPLYCASGWLAGASAALVGPRAAIALATAVERALDRRYAAQIERMASSPQQSALRELLFACRRTPISVDRVAGTSPEARRGALTMFVGRRQHDSRSETRVRTERSPVARRAALVEVQR